MRRARRNKSARHGEEPWRGGRRPGGYGSRVGCTRLTRAVEIPAGGGIYVTYCVHPRVSKETMVNMICVVLLYRRVRGLPFIYSSISISMSVLSGTIFFSVYCIRLSDDNIRFRCR
jgi:hypothetical protein